VLCLQASTGDDKAAESTKMTFGFFDDYFANDPAVADVDVPSTAAASVPVTAAGSASTVIVVKKPLNDVANITVVASNDKKENLKSVAADAMIKQEQGRVTDKKESQIAVTAAATNIEQQSQDTVPSADEEIG
jgi:competence protein ComGC